ncbi:GCC2 and GCC3 domain protein [Ceratobasidium sp. AG-Ba]|nr:GCC2 and GCC3 domain protein [Ceratobasidium sp. AG-Ba]QRW04524.1 GCC2 and GCC3 domain protein [Ceratobasidium sp. AG-Ba]
MRLLSIVALCGVVYATYVPPSEAGLKARATSCPPGQDLHTGGQCTPCPVGSYGLGGTSSCQTCATGSTSGPGAASCTCLPGYRTNPGRNNANDPFCIPCPAGQSSTLNASTCTNCPANMYSDAGGICTLCPPGSTSAPGSPTCSSNCPAGQAPSGPTGRSCANCRPGTYSGPGAAACSDCPAGTYSSGGSSSCDVCPAGSVPNAAGNNCRPCEANTYSNGDNCTACPDGYTSPPGSASCSPRPSGRPVPPVRRAEQMCTSKPGHKWCSNLSGRGLGECVNVLNTAESCGGCVAPEGEEDEDSGKNCYDIENVKDVECHRGRCKIISCQQGYNAGQGRCIPASGHTKSKRAHGHHETF